MSVVKNKVVPKGTAPAAAASPVSSPPLAQNATHEVKQVVEEEEKEISSKDPVTGLEKKEVVKIPVVKTRVTKKGESCSATPKKKNDAKKPEKPVDPNCKACKEAAAVEKKREEEDEKKREGKTPCARCAKQKADKAKADAAAKKKAEEDEERLNPCGTCEKQKAANETEIIPLPVNATHEVATVVEEEEKEIIVKDEKTGKEEKQVLKIAVTKNKIVPKALPVA